MGSFWVTARNMFRTVFAVSGDGPDLTDRVARLAAAAPTPVVATTVLLQRVGGRGDIQASLLMRLSGPGTVSETGAVNWLSRFAGTFGLIVQRLDGEQAPLLRATTPVGIGEPV